MSCSKIKVFKDGSLIGTQRNINLTGDGISAVNNGPESRVDIAVSSSGVAELHSSTVTNWPVNTAKEFPLSPAANVAHAIEVEVFEAESRTANNEPDLNTVAATDRANNVWSSPDTAYAVAITPAATSGDGVNLTRDSGTWGASDVGKLVVGNGGEGYITSQDGSATCTIDITVNFTDTSQIASGSWQMYAVDTRPNVGVALSGGASDALADLLILSDHGDGSTDITDASPNAYTVTVIADTHHETDEAKFTSSSIYCDGVGDRLEVPYNAALAPTHDFTLEWWQYRPATANGGMTYGMNPLSPATSGTLGLMFWGTAIYGSSNGTSWDLWAGTANGISSGAWEHCCFMKDGSGNAIKFYRDGVLITTAGNTNTFNHTGVSLGFGASYNTYAAMYFTDVRLEIGDARYNPAGFTPPAAAFVGGGPFETDAWRHTTTGSNGVIPTREWTTINSLTITDVTTASALAYYALSTDAQATWQIAKTGESPRDIVRNNGGTWEYNSNATYGSTTWSSASTNTQEGALSDAMGVAANQMDDAQCNAASTFPTPGNTMDVAVIMKTTNASATPKTTGFVFNVDTAEYYRKDTGYTIDSISTDAVKIRAPGAGSGKCRVNIFGK